MVGALDALEQWPAPLARAAVVGRHEGVLDVHGDTRRPGRWASVTKLVTALAVLVAVEEEAVRLEEPAGPPGSTVRHLLAHASGLAFDGDAILAKPATMRIYSNTGFEVMATTIGARVGMPFDQYLGEAVLEPLRMSATRMNGTAASGLTGSLDDLVKLTTELLEPTLISARTLAAATAVVFPGLAGRLPGFGAMNPLDWGLGFEVRGTKTPHWTGRRNSPATFGHFGASGSFLWVDPVAGVACAGLSERDFGPWAIEAWPPLADAVLDKCAGTGDAGRHR